MLKRYLYFAFSLLVIFTACPGIARAWTDAVHVKAATEAVDYLPPSIRDMIKKNMKSFIEGIQSEKELSEQINEFSVGALRSKGFERYVYHLQRIKFFLDKNSNAAAQAGEIGMFMKAALDLMEPFPEGSTFKAFEIEGHRIFFDQDFEDNFKRFDFIYDGSQYIKDIPGRVSKDIDFESSKGSLIYGAYKKGAGFRAIESDADAAMNRAVNLVIDQMFTMYQSRAGGKMPPFDPSSFLGLDRFKKKSTIKESEIKKPKPPEAPTVPKKTEIKKEDDSSAEEKDTE